MTNPYPNLRFPGFNDNWELRKIDEILEKSIEQVDVNECENYQEIGIKSHGKGLFHKVPVIGKTIGDKHIYWVKENMFILNIVFAWEQAVGKTTKAETGMVASHRFPMYKPNETLVDLDFILKSFMTRYGKNLLNIASPGGAGRNKTLGQDAFKKLKLFIPKLQEQKKIVHFMLLVDDWIYNLQQQRSHLESYKKGLFQEIYLQKIRFNKNDNSQFSKWENLNLSDVLIERKEKNLDLKFGEVFSVAKEKGVINQIEHLGRSYASSDLSGYKIVYPDDIIYTKSPTADFPYGVIKQNKTGRIGIVSTLYAVYKPKNKYIGSLLQQYFSSSVNIYNYLNPLVHKGAKNTLNISNSEFLKGVKIELPTSEIEQQKISNLINIIDNNLELKQERVAVAEKWKKGLMQSLFI